VRLDTVYVSEGDLAGRNFNVLIDYLIIAYNQRQLYQIQGQDKVNVDVADNLRKLEYNIKQIQSVVFSELHRESRGSEYVRLAHTLYDKYKSLNDRLDGILNNRPLVTVSRTASKRLVPSVSPTASYNIYVDKICSPTRTPSITPSRSLSKTASVTASPTITVSRTKTITPTVSSSISVSNTVSATKTPSITISKSISVSSSVTPTVSRSIIPVSPSISVSGSPSLSESPSITITSSITPSISLSPKAAPTVANTTEDVNTTAATSLDVAFVQTTGNLVVIFISTAVSTALSSISDGFTNLTNLTGTFHIIYKTLAGTEGGNVTMTVTSTKFASIAYNISGHDSAQAPYLSTVATGTSTAPDPTAVTPGAGSNNYLWIAAMSQAGEELDDDTWASLSAGLSGQGFGNLVQKTTGTGGAANTNSSLALARMSSIASSMNPDAFTTAQSLAWIAYAVAIKPA